MLIKSSQRSKKLKFMLSFFEIIGSIILIIIDPSRNNSRKFLDKKYKKIKIYLGGILFVFFLIWILYMILLS